MANETVSISIRVQQLVYSNAVAISLGRILEMKMFVLFVVCMIKEIKQVCLLQCIDCAVH